MPIIEAQETQTKKKWIQLQLAMNVLNLRTNDNIKTTLNVLLSFLLLSFFEEFDCVINFYSKYTYNWIRELNQQR